MAKRTTTITVCDCCGVEYAGSHHPDWSAFTLVNTMAMDGPPTVKLLAIVDDGEICPDCAKALKDAWDARRGAGTVKTVKPTGAP